MDRWLKKTHRVLLELTLILLHIITYGFIIWSVLCQHGIIDCAERTPPTCACHHAETTIAPKKPAHSSRKKSSKSARKKTAAPHHRTASPCRIKPESGRK